MEGEAGANFMLTYSLIFATALLGFLHQPWWMAAAAALLLAAIAANQDSKPARLSSSQTAELAVYAVIARLSLSTVAAVAAFMLGGISRWILGV
jgi:hypothetical protein